MRLFFSGDYNLDQWSEEVWAEDFALMRAASVNLATAVFSWSRLQPSPDRFDFGWLERVLDGLHAAGVDVGLPTPTASPPPWFTRLHPDALPVTRQGVRLIHGRRAPARSARHDGVAEFSLGRAYRELTGVAGVLDDATEPDQVGYFTVVLDGVPQEQMKATHGRPVEFRVDVTGVLRLGLVAYRPDTKVGALLGGVLTAGGQSRRLPELVWGNPTLLA